MNLTDLLQIDSKRYFDIYLKMISEKIHTYRLLAWDTNFPCLSCQIKVCLARWGHSHLCNSIKEVFVLNLLFEALLDVNWINLAA